MDREGGKIHEKTRDGLEGRGHVKVKNNLEVIDTRKRQDDDDNHSIGYSDGYSEGGQLSDCSGKEGDNKDDPITTTTTEGMNTNTQQPGITGDERQAIEIVKGLTNSEATTSIIREIEVSSNWGLGFKV